MILFLLNLPILTVLAGAAYFATGNKAVRKTPGTSQLQCFQTLRLSGICFTPGENFLINDTTATS